MKLDPLKPATPAPTATPTKDQLKARDKAVKLTHEFEDMFVQQMVSAMRQSAQMGDEEGGMFGSGPGSDTYAQWFDQNLGQKVAQSGRVGVADVLVRQLEQHHEIVTLPKAQKQGKHEQPLHLRMDPRKGGTDVVA